ncbi:transmembrane channel-like protein 5 [Toxorhynchites rutilus septentrionalis]|uniref:transmembrane channel-like protein 5 n=1 Tax=Toxorhynchites rutilus septentrionalis TaxID=329112 RepID=UPI002479DC9B|nr:transmembrane channel-like protein 5 [Toxorhynchites rutilus septentrionalis]
MAHRHRRTVSDVFNIEVANESRLQQQSPDAQHLSFAEASKCSPSSSSSDFQNTSDSNFLLRVDDAYRDQYHHEGGGGDGKQNQIVNGSVENNANEDGENYDDEVQEFDDKEGSSHFEMNVAAADSSRAASRVAVDSFRRWSANFGKTIKNNKRHMYNKTIRFMPSRLRKTLSIDGDLITTTASDVEQITLELEQREQLMEDNPMSEQLRIEAIKSMAQALSIKRQIRANLTCTVNRRSISRSKSVSFLRKCKYSGKVYATRFVKFVAHVVTSFELFYGSMKEIEGHFGGRISAYFKFLRWLLVLNLALVVFMFWFVSFPQILYTGSERYDTEMQGKDATVEARAMANVRSKFEFTDLFTGEGYFTNSILFYGFYSNTSFTLIPGTSEYSLPHAYFLTTVVMYLATFVVVSVSMARSYRISFIEASGSVHNILTHKIFCSWDFGIANEKAAQLKHASIFTELQEHLTRLNRTATPPGRWQKLRMTALRISTHSFVFLMIASIGFGIWMLLQRFGETEHFNTWSALYVSISTNITILVAQFIFRFISRIEDYRPSSTTLNINLMRNFLLQLCIVGTLMFYWLNKTYDNCWETSIGQEIYRLVVIDFIVSVLCLTSLQATRYAANRFYSRSISLPEFCLTNNSLALVYNQSLLWFGLLFSPLLCVIVTIKLLLIFYVKKQTLLYFCKPPTKMWRSSQTQTLFLVLVFVSLFGVMMTYAYIMTHVPISGECGPFRGNTYMYQLFMQGILKLREEHIFWKIFMYVTKPAIIGGVLLTMGVVTYYLRAKSKAQIAKVKLLKEMLCMEAKDKEFLLANISKITRGKEWYFDKDFLNLRKHSADKYYSDPSGTWRYAESPRKVNGNTVLREDDGSPNCSGYQRIDECNEEHVRMRRF